MTNKILPPYYSAKFIMKRKPVYQGMIRIDQWRFQSEKTGRKYIVDVEVYDKHIYSVKFYPKEKANSKSRFSCLTGDFEPRRIVLTCIYILKIYIESDEQSSFAFVGAHSEGEPQESNKRFRFYSRMMTTYVGESIFEHYSDEEKGAYLLARKRELSQGNLSVEIINNFFQDIYLFEE